MVLEFPQLPFLTREMLEFGQESQLQLRVRSRSIGANLVTIRGLTRAGIFHFSHTTLGVASTFSEAFGIPDVPIHLIVQAPSADIEHGEIFVEVTLEINGDAVAILASGYITSIRPIGWPTPGADPSRPGGGVISVIESADPAAGAELTDIVNANEIWRIQSIRFQLITDATSTSRVPHVVIGDGTNPLIDIVGLGQTASLTRDHTFAAFGSIEDNFDNDDVVGGLPNNLLLPNPFTIDTDTVNLQAGDNYGPMRILVERFIA